MKFLLSIKHWQFCLLLLLFAIVLNIVFLPLFLASFHLENFERLSIFGLVYSLVFLMVHCGWFYYIGVRLYDVSWQKKYLSLTRFKIAALFPIFNQVVFIILSVAGILVFDENMEVAITHPLLIVISFFTVACMLYLIYFCSKALKMVELERQVKHSDYGNLLFLFFFIPIGIWFIQPRINKIFKTNTNSEILDTNI